MRTCRTIATLIATAAAVIMFGCTGSDSPKAESTLKEQAAVSGGADPVCSAGQLSITSNFNGTPIAAGDVIWFSSVFKPSGFNAATTVHLFYRNGTITLPGFPPIPVPDADITLAPGATSATTTRTPTDWITDLPTSFSGNAFLSGVAVPVPSGLPGGVKPVTWSGTITADAPIVICWKWAAAVYTQFPDAAAPAVKAVDDNHFPPYPSSDHAGTPENDKMFVTGGARGGGGANYTGSLSGTQCITVPTCGCIPATTCPPEQNCGTAPDECGGSINCGTCTSGEVCIGGTCEPGCNPIGATNGPDLVACSCSSGPAQIVAACGSCADVAQVCSAACGACGSAGEPFPGQCFPNFSQVCPVPPFRQCALPIPPPSLGSDLVQCGCALNTVLVNACGSCDTLAATCAEVCATCGGASVTVCLNRNDASCPAAR